MAIMVGKINPVRTVEDREIIIANLGEISRPSVSGISINTISGHCADQACRYVYLTHTQVIVKINVAVAVDGNSPWRLEAG